MINFNCPKCAEELSVPDSLAGQMQVCPACGEGTPVPTVPGADAAPGTPSSEKPASETPVAKLSSRHVRTILLGGVLLVVLVAGVLIFLALRQSQGQTREELILDLGKGVTMKLVLVPAGKFLMGSPADEKGRNDNEGPQHEVTISRPFFMGVYEVTLKQYGTLRPLGLWGLAAEDSRRFPVRVTSQGAGEFCEALSKKTGKTVRLPTEAEWEYACRAGTTTRFSFGDNQSKLRRYGNYAGRSRSSFGEDVLGGRFKPNAFGLYDMHGNHWEWCSDAYGENYYRNSPGTDPKGPDKGRYQVLRGGSWRSPPDECRAAHRGKYGVWQNTRHCGFRVVVESGPCMD